MTCTVRRGDAAPASPGAWLGRAFAALLLVFFVLFFVVPLVWFVLAPTKTDRQLLLENPFAIGDIPTLIHNWGTLVDFQKGLIWTWLGNSAFYCLASLAITLAISIPAGYALALTEFPGRRALLALTLVVMLVPSTALVLPIFLELSAVQLIGNPLSVILPFSFFPFGVYLTYIYFSTAISRDLLDAARIDGAGEFQVFRMVAMPLATPVIALVGFFSFIEQLEQLLPALRDGARTQGPDSGRHCRTAVERGSVQPDQRGIDHHLALDPRLGHLDCGGAGAHRVSLLAALPCDRHDGRRDEGVTPTWSGRSTPRLSAPRSNATSPNVVPRATLATMRRRHFVAAGSSPLATASRAASRSFRAALGARSG